MFLTVSFVGWIWVSVIVVVVFFVIMIMLFFDPQKPIVLDAKKCLKSRLADGAYYWKDANSSHPGYSEELLEVLRYFGFSKPDNKFYNKKLNTRLFCFPNCYRPEEIIGFLERRNYHVATFAELVEYGATYHDQDWEQDNYCSNAIVALAAKQSDGRGGQLFPQISFNADGQRICEAVNIAVGAKEYFAPGTHFLVIKDI